MPKSKQQKQAVFERLVTALPRAKSFIIVNFKGLTVKEVEALRRQARQAGVSYEVIKRTLLKKVLQKIGITLDISTMSGEIAIAMSEQDEVLTPKVLFQFAKTHEPLKLLGGWFNGASLSKEAVLKLALVPSRPELLTQLVYIIGSPVTGLVRVLAGTLSKLVYVLAAVKNKKT